MKWILITLLAVCTMAFCAMDCRAQDEQADEDSAATQSLAIDSVAAFQPVINTVSIYPNPATHYLILDFDIQLTESVTVTIFDLHGKILKQEKFNATAGPHQKNFQLQGFEKGAYLLQLRGADFKETRRFIVKG